MPRLDEPMPTGLTLPPGPVTVDFRQSVERAIADMIPDGRQGAAVAVASIGPDGKPKLIVGVAARLGDHWTLAGDVEKIWSGPITGRVMLIGSW